MKWNPIVLPILIMTTAASPIHRAWATSFGDDAAFLKSHTELIAQDNEFRVALQKCGVVAKAGGPGPMNRRCGGCHNKNRKNNKIPFHAPETRD